MRKPSPPAIYLHDVIVGNMGVKVFVGSVGDSGSVRVEFHRQREVHLFDVEPKHAERLANALLDAVNAERADTALKLRLRALENEVERLRKCMCPDKSVAAKKKARP